MRMLKGNATDLFMSDKSPFMRKIVSFIKTGLGSPDSRLVSGNVAPGMRQ